MQRKKENSTVSFDEDAQGYDSGKASQFANKCYAYVFNIIRHIQFDNILDVGCGTGTFMTMVLEEKPQVKGYGIDFSNEMLKIASTKVPKRTKLIHGMAEELPYENKKFDLVVMIDSFGYFGDPKQAIKEVYRVLKPGGKLVMADRMGRGIMRYFNHSYTEQEIRECLMQAGFDVVSLMKNIPGGYIATGDKHSI